MIVDGSSWSRRTPLTADKKTSFSAPNAWATALAAVLLVGVGLVTAAVSPGRIESLPGFYGLFGFGAFSLAVLSGWPLGRLLRRPERYYDNAESRDVD